MYFHRSYKKNLSATHKLRSLARISLSVYITTIPIVCVHVWECLRVRVAFLINNVAMNVAYTAWSLQLTNVNGILRHIMSRQVLLIVALVWKGLMSNPLPWDLGQAFFLLFHFTSPFIHFFFYYFIFHLTSPFIHVSIISFNISSHSLFLSFHFTSPFIHLSIISYFISHLLWFIFSVISYFILHLLSFIFHLWKFTKTREHAQV